MQHNILHPSFMWKKTPICNLQKYKNIATSSNDIFSVFSCSFFFFNITETHLFPGVLFSFLFCMFVHCPRCHRNCKIVCGMLSLCMYVQLLWRNWLNIQKKKIYFPHTNYIFFTEHQKRKKPWILFRLTSFFGIKTSIHLCDKFYQYSPLGTRKTGFFSLPKEVKKKEAKKLQCMIAYWWLGRWVFFFMENIVNS